MKLTDLNRAPLYRDRRDFIIQPGDSGMAEHYPANPPHQPKEQQP